MASVNRSQLYDFFEVGILPRQRHLWCSDALHSDSFAVQGTRGLVHALLVALLLTDTGCGFHLRGSRALELQVAKVFVASQAAELVATEVRRQLGYSDIALVSEPGAAEAVVTLSNERFDERVLSVDPRTGKVREYELGYEVDFTVTRPDGSPLLEQQTVSLLRDYTFDETAALGKFEEEQVLREEMKKDAAETILRRLQTVRVK